MHDQHRSDLLRAPDLGVRGRLHASLDALAEVPAWSASRGEQRTALVELARAKARLEELWLRLLAAGDRNDVAADSAATSTAAWLAARDTSPPRRRAADVRLAAGLDDDRAATREALARGDLDLEQARVVVARCGRCPRRPSPRTRRVPGAGRGHAAGPRADARRAVAAALGRHILHVLDPEAADRRLGQQLEREERAAARATFLELHDNGDGTHGGRLRIPGFHAAALTKMLDAIANPARPDQPCRQHAPARRGAPVPERRGQAFCELLERIPADRLPTSGGVTPPSSCSSTTTPCCHGLGTARLDTGERISAGLARRLACEAGVIPAVVRRLVDGRSVVLDMGRKRRLHTEHMRIALAVEQGGCTAEHCDRPAGWCHAHHDVPWSAGGPTSVTNGRLLCSFHHHKAHSPGYTLERLPSGQVRFHRRT